MEEKTQNIIEALGRTAILTGILLAPIFFAPSIAPIEMRICYSLIGIFGAMWVIMPLYR